MKNISFTPWASFDTGSYPSIAVNAHGTIISGHQREAFSKIYYNVGKAYVNAPEIANTGIEFDKGAPPRVAINDNNVALEIHKSNGTKDNLWYHAGYVNVSNGTWAHGESKKNGNGHDPDIDLNNANQVAAVHQKDGKIYCRSGKLNTSDMKISFRTTIEVGAGSVPTVAINAQGKVVVVYHSSTDNNLQYWLGQMNVDDVRRVGSGWAGLGTNPSVGVTDDGFVLLGFARDGNSYTVGGQVGDNAIIFTPEMQYAYGNNPWVDANGNWGVQVYSSADMADWTMYASSSEIWDRTNWMSASSRVQAKKLRHLVLPGSHDAGMYKHQNCTFDGTQCNTRTQFVDIGRQLSQGSRYFDLRPVWYGGKFYTGHYASTPVGIQGCNGQDLDGVLGHVKEFMQSTTHEVAILKFSHYYNKTDNVMCFSKEIMDKLMDLVATKLNGVLFINTTTSRLADLTVATITANGSRAIAVFQFVPNKESSSASDKGCTCKDASGPLCVTGSNGPNAAKGLYSYADYCPACPPTADLTVYDQYSSTNNVDTMMANQWSKQGTTANHGGDLFLLSWTLTQSGVQATACGVTWMDSIVAIANNANVRLYSKVTERYGTGGITLATIPNILYVDLCNGFATDVARWLNDRL